MDVKRFEMMGRIEKGWIETWNGERFGKRR